MEEMLDVFDINGNHLGVRSRSFCHSENPGVYHKPVWVWIINKKGQILVQKRASCKTQHPNKWDISAAGHVDAGETLLQGCVRETTEELGLDVKEQDFELVKTFVHQPGWEIVNIYILHSNAKEEDMILQEKEVSEVKWLDYKDFEQLLYSENFVAHTKQCKDLMNEILKNMVKEITN